MHEIEPRPYGPVLTREEEETLRAQVTLLAPDIICWHEAPVPSTFQLDVYAKKLDELARMLDGYFLMLDLSNTVRPGPSILAHLRVIVADMIKPRHAAVVTGKYFILSVAVKFVMARVGFNSFSIYRTREVALEAIERKRH